MYCNSMDDAYREFPKKENDVSWKVWRLHGVEDKLIESAGDGFYADPDNWIELYELLDTVFDNKLYREVGLTSQEWLTLVADCVGVSTSYLNRVKNTGRWYKESSMYGWRAPKLSKETPGMTLENLNFIYRVRRYSEKLAEDALHLLIGDEEWRRSKRAKAQEPPSVDSVMALKDKRVEPRVVEVAPIDLNAPATQRQWEFVCDLVSKGTVPDEEYRQLLENDTVGEANDLLNKYARHPVNLREIGGSYVIPGACSRLVERMTALEAGKDKGGTDAQSH